MEYVFLFNVYNTSNVIKREKGYRNYDASNRRKQLDMRTLYESILDDDLDTKTDTIVNIYNTTINVFGRQKEGIDPIEFFEFYRACLDNNSTTLFNNLNPYKCSKEEFIAIHNYINLMHKKYGQKDIYLSAWSLYEGDYMMYEIVERLKDKEPVIRQILKEQNDIDYLMDMH